MKLLLLAPEFDFTDEWRAALKSALPDAVLYEDVASAPVDIELALVYNPPPRVLARFVRLQAIVTLSAGVDGLLVDNSLPDVPIVRLANSDIAQLMKEYIVYQVLRIHRDFQAIEQLKAWKWMPLAMPAGQRRIGIMGMGRLGSTCAVALRSLGFMVAGWCQNPKDLQGIPVYTGDDGLSTLLNETDILICILPLTVATAGILCNALFIQLPIGASLINVSRGKCVNESDLLKQLDMGRINHATLDVFSTEPLETSHPFWSHSQISITPHMAADARPGPSAQEIKDIVIRLRNGDPLINVVDRVKCY